MWLYLIFQILLVWMCSNLLSQFSLDEHYIICSLSAITSYMHACVYSSFLMRVYLWDNFIEFVHLAVAELFSCNAKTVFSPVGSMRRHAVCPASSQYDRQCSYLYFVRSYQTDCLAWKLREYFTSEVFPKHYRLLGQHIPYLGSELSWSSLDHSRASPNCCCEDWWYKATNNRGF